MINADVKLKLQRILEAKPTHAQVADAKVIATDPATKNVFKNINGTVWMINEDTRDIFRRSMKASKDRREHSLVEGKTIKLGYDALNVFQQYWTGQSDPLYAVLSRRGNSVSWVSLKASSDEIDRIKDVAQEIIDDPKSSASYKRVAQKYLKL